jgi:hypothetical protein
VGVDELCFADSGERCLGILGGLSPVGAASVSVSLGFKCLACRGKRLGRCQVVESSGLLPPGLEAAQLSVGMFRRCWVSTSHVVSSMKLCSKLLCYSMSNHLSILSWNVCGLNTPAMREAVRGTITEANPMITCLQEVKMSSFTPQLLAETVESRLDKFSLLPA